MIKLGVKSQQEERQLDLSDELESPVPVQKTETVEQTLPKSHLYKRLKKLSFLTPIM